MDAHAVLDNVTGIAAEFADQRRERQQRGYLDPADFDALADAGVLLTGAPATMGGLWVDIGTSTRPFCEILRVIATGDPAVALVAAMHPAVLGFWLTRPEAPAPHTAAWRKQSERFARSALEGHWWGTVTSEPGSGGDVSRTTATAVPRGDGGFGVSGVKHFGSGSGLTSFMITTAIPDGESEADLFVLDVRGAFDPGGMPPVSDGKVRLVAAWDGVGMGATQSHAYEFVGFPAERIAWPGSQAAVTGVAGAFFSALFTAVIVGVVQSAHAAAAARVAPRHDTLRPFEAVEWARVETEFWTLEQAYERLLQLIEARGSGALLDAQHAKLAIAELAESVLQRMCRVVGGGTFSRSSHVGAAFQDVRALGFLRPPWALAYDQLLALTWTSHRP